MQHRQEMSIKASSLPFVAYGSSLDLFRMFVNTNHTNASSHGVALGIE
jgi:hypothetical protein